MMEVTWIFGPWKEIASGLLGTWIYHCRCNKNDADYFPVLNLRLEDLPDIEKDGSSRNSSQRSFISVSQQTIAIKAHQMNSGSPIFSFSKCV